MQVDRLETLKTLMAKLGRDRTLESKAKNLDMWLERKAGYFVDAVQKTSLFASKQQHQPSTSTFTPTILKDPFYRIPMDR